MNINCWYRQLLLAIIWSGVVLNVRSGMSSPLDDTSAIEAPGQNRLNPEVWNESTGDRQSLSDSPSETHIAPEINDGATCSCPQCSAPSQHPWNGFSWPVLFRHGERNDPQRSVGRGDPLIGTSWLNRPHHAGWFMGGIIADEMVDGRADPERGFFGGYRFGWDFDHYWGTEIRLGFAHLDLRGSRRESRDFLGDVNLLRYPWGDSRWRPYFSVGLGAANFRFVDNTDVRYNELLVNIPVGAGLKFYYKKWLVLRLDALDNIAIGASGINTMHNVSLTGGVEIRFGGWRRSYYPWHPSNHYW